MIQIPTEFQIPAELLVRAVKEQPDLDKVTLSGLANTLKGYGLKDAYRKVQKLPRRTPARLDTTAILQHYGPEASDAGRDEPVEKVNVATREMSASNQTISATDSPEIVNRKFVKTPSYREMERLLQGDNRLNIFANGDSGLGKTSCILDIMRRQNREVIRFNCSYHQDVDDFIGGHRLVNGDTVYFDGAVIVAQERGAALLLDEVDAADPKLLFEIQSVLEGNGVLLKKVGRMSYPKAGFQVIATGNTKGRGDLTGEFAGTNVLNKSFLDRFDAAMTWEPPQETDMNSILSANSSLSSDVTQALAAWYQKILEAVDGGVQTTIVSPRRMLSIAKICENWKINEPIHADLPQAVKVSLNGFDDDVREAYINIMDLLIEDVKKEKIPEAKAKDILEGDEPF